MNYIEIQQQADRQTAQSRVGQQLRPVNWKCLLDSLQFNDDDSLDEEINTVSGVKMNGSVLDRQSNLRFSLESQRLKFVLKASGVRTLQKSRSRLGVDSDRGPNYPLGQFGVKKHVVHSVSSVFSAVAISPQDRGQR